MLSMAASSITPAQAELISSLTPDEVPIKLRCAICSKLAVNAFRLPCCEQAICETCQSTLPSSCPVCEHAPLSADDCKPHKNLRTTIRVFLKTEEKKRGGSHPKESEEPTPTTTPVEPKPAPVPVVADKSEAADGSQETSEDVHTAGDAAAADQPSVPEVNGAREVSIAQPQEQSDEKDVSQPEQAQEDREESEDADDVEIILHRKEDQLENGDSGEHTMGAVDGDDNGAGGQQDGQQGAVFAGGVGFDSANGQFSNMNFGGGDFNQMQMMMAMQNGMPPNAFGAFPMMGMGMDPMMMQNMYMSGGFGSQGMGMSGMNMGMGGFNGGVGSGSDNNWNGQQSWNVGQDNFNHPNASGMGNGDYGSFNSGFHTGFNQGNFGHQGQFNDYRGNRYGYQRGGRFGRGGRGGYGFNRGGYGFGANGNQPGQGYAPSQYPSGTPDQASNGATVSAANQEGVDEYGRTMRPEKGNDEQGSTEGNGGAATNTEDAGAVPGGDKAADEAASSSTSVKDGTQAATQSIPTLGDSRSPQVGDSVSVGDPSMGRIGTPTNGYQNHNRGVSSGGMPSPAVPAADVPINAPKGPKAMLQGLPNTSLLKLRARGYLIPGDKVQSPKTNGGGFASPAADAPGSRSSSPGASKRQDSEHRDQSGERDRDADKSRDRHGRDRDRSETPSSREYSRSRDHRDSRKRRRHRSRSASLDERDEDRYHRRHRRKHSTYAEDDDPKSRPRDDKYDERSRSASPDESKHSGHRSRKDRDSRRRRDREDERERDSDYEYRRKSSHRSHRDREYDRDRDGEKEKDKDRAKDRTRNRDREKERDRDRRHRSKRTSAEPPTPREPADDEFNPPTAPRGPSSSITGAKGLEIKGASRRSREAAESSRRSSVSSSKVPPTAPAAASDPHAAEREARNRERLLRETQRLAGLTGSKRRSDDGEEAKRSRRKGRRGEVVTADDEEARMRRLEAERERSRWG